MVNASLINRLSHAVDLIEQRSQQNRPIKVVTVRRGRKEDPDAALDRHFAAHPVDRGANVVIFKLYRDEEMADETQDCAPSSTHERLR
jgi:hypothetical protein